jgi:hypothetical protein
LVTAGLLDRIASRRYLLDPAAHPAWWTPYQLPAPLATLSPRPDSRLFASDSSGRLQGGLFSLDGVHGTTITYAILAQEFINIMAGAGMPFLGADGRSIRTEPTLIDFAKMIAAEKAAELEHIRVKSVRRHIHRVDQSYARRFNRAQHADELS